MPDVSCGHCKNSIEGALAPLEGVSGANVDVDGRSVVVEYDPDVVARESVVRAIEDVGYPVAS